jgi:hypothetical protein
VQALAIHPDPRLSHTAVTVTAIRPNGSRETLIAFHPQAGWARRFWFREPIPLPRGTRLELRAIAEDEALQPPGAPPRQPVDPSAVRVTLDVVGG